MTQQKLTPDLLYTRCDPEQFSFSSTDALQDLEGVIGQDRAMEAIRFGIGIRQEGFNLYALGPSGSGKRSVITQFIKTQAAKEPVPSDWCYVDNFNTPHKPLALSLPAGMGIRLQQDMAQLVEELRTTVPRALESEEYLTRRREIEESYTERQEQAFESLTEEANRHDIAMLRTPTGFAFAPRKNGKVLDPKEYEKLPAKEQEKIEAVVAQLQERLQHMIQQGPKWRREMLQEIKLLNRDVIMSAVDQLIDQMRRDYAELPQVLSYLNAVEQDVVEHTEEFRAQDESEVPLQEMLVSAMEQPGSFLKRYQINTMIDHSQSQGAPVIYVDSPTHQNLVGRIEHQAHMGTLFTNFTMIKPGALHQANGGYLILDARKLLLQPYSWEGLKRVLESKKIRIESLSDILSLTSTTSLEPEPIPLDVKVVILGERLLYALLCEYDPEFSELFKVAADFNDSIDRNEQNTQQIAQLIATLIRRDQLRHLNAAAVARVIEHSSRMIEDAEKMTSRFGKVADFLREADYWAGEAKHDLVTAEDIEHTIAARERRLSRIRERLQEETLRDTLLIESEGEQVGQVNGLSVMQFGDYVFGHPSRITARVHIGKGEVIDIEREVELGGPIHSKGVLILHGYLTGLYCPDHPISLSASLVFEQNYGEIEGDSASSAELYTLLSALSNVPLKQSIAVTGSVNQLGQIQAIGGVNEKIEGFFDLCKARGLTGEQGVIIPASNIKHLMLKQEVVNAVQEQQFDIYAVDNVNEGIEILTGRTAGSRDEQGEFPEQSINRLVEDRLILMAKQAHENENTDAESSKEEDSK
jgi:lon-related putative ATP-dependent protease